MNVRAVTRADLERLAAVAAADEEAIIGHRSRVGPDDVAGWLERTELEHDSWLFERDGEVVAFGWFSAYGPSGFAAGVVAQGWKGQGLGTRLAERGEARARARGLERMQGFGLAADTAARELFLGRGYTEVRRFYDMAIELGEPPEVPPLPDGLVLEGCRREDYRAFYDTLVEAFQDHWDWHATPYDEWLALREGQHEDAQGPLWWLIRDGEEIAAICRNDANRNGGGYVGALGVRRPWRGKGLAKALLLHTFADFHRRGTPRVTLGVDADSPTGATHLYERVGMKVEAAMVVYEKLLT